LKTTKASPAQLKKFTAAVKAFLKQAEMEPAELSESLDLDRRRVKNWIIYKSCPSVEAIADFTVRMKANQESTNKAAAAYDNFFQAV
jgi:hypothetical protein